MKIINISRKFVVLLLVLFLLSTFALAADGDDDSNNNNNNNQQSSQDRQESFMNRYLGKNADIRDHNPVSGWLSGVSNIMRMSTGKEPFAGMRDSYLGWKMKQITSDNPWSITYLGKDAAVAQTCLLGNFGGWASFGDGLAYGLAEGSQELDGDVLFCPDEVCMFMSPERLEFASGTGGLAGFESENTGMLNKYLYKLPLSLTTPNCPESMQSENEQGQKECEWYWEFNVEFKSESGSWVKFIDGEVVVFGDSVSYTGADMFIFPSNNLYTDVRIKFTDMKPSDKQPRDYMVGYGNMGNDYTDRDSGGNIFVVPIVKSYTQGAGDLYDIDRNVNNDGGSGGSSGGGGTSSQSGDTNYGI